MTIFNSYVKLPEGNSTIVAPNPGFGSRAVGATAAGSCLWRWPRQGPRGVARIFRIFWEYGPKKISKHWKKHWTKTTQKTIHETTLGVYGFSMVRNNQIINIGYHDICEFCEFHEIFVRQIGDSVGLRKFFSDVPIPSLGKNRKNQSFSSVHPCSLLGGSSHLVSGL